MGSSTGNNLFKEIAKKSDIVQVVSYYLGANALRRSGKRYVSLCPFHNDSHPSMQIDPERNNFHCYVCDSYGDSITFVEKYAHLEPLEALKKVAEICNIPLPQGFSAKKKEDLLVKNYPNELKALSELCHFYQLSLQAKDGKVARDYLNSRGMDAETIEHFGLGFAPFDASLSINALRKMGYDVQTLERAGILAPTAVIKDRQDGRIIFPIEDNDGHVVGFSGRRFLPNQDGGKYVNSPETDLFHKGKILYHYNKAKEMARKDGYIYVVEGYMDAIAFQRAGINSVVAIMGATLTSDQADALKELHVECRLFLDSDEAGQQGEERALPVLLDKEIPTRIGWKLTGGKDADEILTKKGKEALLLQVQRLYDAPMFLLGRRLKGRKFLLESQEIESYLKEVRPYLLALGEVSRARDIRQIAKRTNLSEEEISSILNLNAMTKVPTEKETAEESGTETEGRKRRRSPRQRKPEPVVATKLSNKYNVSDIIHRLFVYLQEIHVGEGMDEDLQKNELIIVLTLPKSRLAYLSFLRSHIIFCQNELNALADMIGNIYLTHDDIPSFGKEEYDILLSKLDGTTTESEKKEEDAIDDAFDLDDDEKEVPELPNDSRVALYQIVQESKQLDAPLYDQVTFQNFLDKEQALINIRNFQKAVAKEKESGEPLSVSVLAQSFQTYRKKKS